MNFTAPDIHKGLAFGLTGIVPKGDTFVEPTITVTTAQGGTVAGTVAMEASVQGAADTEGNVPFTTAGNFTPASAYTGPVVLSVEVQGVEDAVINFNVLGPLAPETATVDPTKFVAS